MLCGFIKFINTTELQLIIIIRSLIKTNKRAKPQEAQNDNYDDNTHTQRIKKPNGVISVSIADYRSTYYDTWYASQLIVQHTLLAYIQQFELQRLHCMQLPTKVKKERDSLITNSKMTKLTFMLAACSVAYYSFVPACYLQTTMDMKRERERDRASKWAVKKIEKSCYEWKYWLIESDKCHSLNFF